MSTSESKLASLKLDLNLSKPAELEAYQKLKDLPSAYDRKQLIVSSVNSAKVEDITNISFLARVKSISFLSYIRGLMLLVSFCLIVISVDFTYNFNSLAMSPFWALLLSGSVVVFTSFAFTLASYSSRRMAAVLVLLWFLGVSYSIFTALAGQYNSFRTYNAQDARSSQEVDCTLLQEQYDSNLKRISEYKEQLRPYQSIVEDLSSSPEKKVEYPQTWKDATSKVALLQDKIDLLYQDNSLILQQLRDAKDHSFMQVEHRTIYSWLAQLLGVRADLLQFLVITFPSVFIDLVSSVLLKFSIGKKRHSI